VKVPGLPEGSALSRDGKELYVSIPVVSVSKPNQSGTLYGYSVSPSSATKNGSLTYPYGNFDLAYAGTTTGSSAVADVFKDTSTGGVFDVDTVTLSLIKAAPAVTAPLEYGVFAPGTGVQNSYFVDRSGNFRVYNAAANTYSKAISGITSALSPGLPVLAVPPSGSPVYALIVNKVGSGSSTIDVINPNTVSVTKTIPISFPCYEITPDAQSQHIYAIGETVTNNVPSFHIAVITTSNNVVDKTITVPDSTVRVSPFMAVTPDGKNLLLTASTGSGSVSASLDVVSASTGALVEKVAIPLGPGSAPVQGEQVFTVP
jgi:hypothetical protein